MIYLPKSKKNSSFLTYRNRTLYLRRRKGKTYKELSIDFGISRERCRQIFLKYQRFIDAGIVSDPYSES